MYKHQSNEPNRQKDMFEHRICDIWSMNFFANNPERDMESRVSKKDQFNHIRQSINQDKRSRLAN